MEIIKEYIGNYPQKQKVNVSVLKQLWQRKQTGKLLITESQMSKKIKILNELPNE
jgi:hypothetical protein